MSAGSIGLVVRWLVLLASVPCIAICLLTPTARWWFTGATLANASLHAAILLLPAVVVWRARPRVSAGLLIAMLCGAAPWLIAAWQTRAPLPVAERPVIQVASANLYLYNDKALRAPALAAVLAERPAIVVLAEAIASEDRAGVSPIDYPYQLWQQQPNRKWRDCVALLSRYPIVRSTPHDLEEQPFLEATLDIDGRPLHVIAVHTMSPVSATKLEQRNQQLHDIAEVIVDLTQREPAPVLLMGDCNLAVGTPAWRDLAARSQLKRVAQAEPATWPDWLGPVAITIDHILGRDLALGPQRAFIIPGSDHRGLRGSIQLP